MKSIYIIFLIVSISFIAQSVKSQKTDTIYHINGNILTGELKKLVYGVATWKMDGMGTISMEEVKIKTIKSKKLFEIKMKDGLIHFGSIDTSNQDRKLYIIKTDGKELIHIEDIVEIYPIKRNFWMRSSGNFSLGASFSKGSDVGSVAFSGNLNYRKQNSYFSLSWDDNNTFQGDSISSSKSDVIFGVQRLLKKSWSLGAAIGATQNTELGTKLRLDLSVIGIKDISYNNWNRFYAGAGLSIARETPYNDSPIANDLAGVFTLVWKVYKYTIPKVWVDANITYIPYITGPQRHRTSFNLNPKVSILSDNFKIGLSFYYNYDSSPSTNASTDDYGINLQLSYSFH